MNELRTICVLALVLSLSTLPAQKVDEFPRPRGFPETQCSSAWRRHVTLNSTPCTQATGCFIVTCHIT